ncbi:MAG: lysophospholipid acyltransferase family protein [Thermoleophilia bacterium]
MSEKISADRLSPAIYAISRVLITRPLRFLYGIEVIGAENWPERGPAIIASNHSSNMDPPLLCLSYPGYIRWMGKAEILKVPVLGWYLYKVGAFRVRRGENDREAIRSAQELVEAGHIIGMFPEGTRHRDGRFGEPQAGVGLLAVKLGVPVIPVRLRGNDQIFRNKRPHRPRVTVTVGKPVDLEITGMSRGRAYREAARRIMAAIEAI